MSRRAPLRQATLRALSAIATDRLVRIPMLDNSCDPLVTIGIPTYNRAARNLRKVIERSLEQTYRNVEVIVSDNCSSDHTPELVRSIDDPRLRYFRQGTNIGPNRNFNYCLQQAKGAYFLLFHDDDMIDEDFIEACISSVKPGETVGVVITGVRIIDEHDNVLERHKNTTSAQSSADFILGWFKDTPALYLCNTLYNTEKLKEAGGFRSKKNLYDDLVATFTLIAKYGRVDVRDVKAGFRRHSGNRGSTIPIQDWVEDSQYLLDLLCHLLPDDRRTLRKAGNRHFCKKMYRYVTNGTAASESLADYVNIYKSFGYCYSPLRYFYGNMLGHRIGGIKRMLSRS
jgi:glycosyltransferase involved in cell wall biosynthesis